MLSNWNKLSQDVVDSPSLKVEVLKSHLDVVFGDRVLGDYGSSGLMVGLDDHEDLFQSWWFWVLDIFVFLEET